MFVSASDEAKVLEIADQLYGTLMDLNASGTWFAEQRDGTPYDLVSRALNVVLGEYGPGHGLGIYMACIANGTTPSETVAYLRETGQAK